jgi:hypothetical protein
MIKFYTKLPCTCGGVISKMSWPQHVLFNSGFMILAIVGIQLEKNINKNKEEAAGY